jgi:hypothetical protein
MREVELISRESVEADYASLLRDGFVFYRGTYTETAVVWSDALEQRANEDGLLVETRFSHPGNDIFEYLSHAFIAIQRPDRRPYYPHHDISVWHAMRDEVRQQLDTDWDTLLARAKEQTS